MPTKPGVTLTKTQCSLQPTSHNAPPLNHYHANEGKWCAVEGSEVSWIREGCDHRFQNF